MSKNKKRLFLAIFISVCMHASAITTYAIYSKKTDDSFSNRSNGKSFSILLTQISIQNTNQELNANSSESNHQISHKNSIEALDEIEKAKIIEEEKDVKTSEIPDKNSDKNSLKKIIKPKKHHNKKCQNCKKSGKNNHSSTQTSAIKKANDFDKAGGNLSNGSSKNLNKNNGGNSISGLIYQAILKHKTYPKKAQIMKLSGSVKVTFKLNDENKFEILKVTKSSGFEMLDKHALKIIQNAKNDFPQTVTNHQITVSINFNLKE